MPICFLVGASPQAGDAPRISPGDFVIAADGGLDRLRRWGVAPDLVIGDMDSLSSALPFDIPCVKFPREKDETDMALALNAGLERGFNRFELLGAAGGRPDHTFANVQLLVKAARLGAEATLHMGGWRCTALCGKAALKLKGKGTVSVFAYGEKAKGVSITGMKYRFAGELDGAAPLGISNELAGVGQISLEEGTLLCCWELR